MKRQDKIFINLTNGIEAIDKYNLNIEDVSYIRLLSCHCERSNFIDILDDLDNNFYMYLALGYNCIVYDFSANSENSKAMYIGLYWVEYVLRRRWFGETVSPQIKGWDVSERFDMFYKKIDRKLRRKLDYFKKYLNCSSISIQTICSETANDNKADYYVELLLNAVNKEI